MSTNATFIQSKRSNADFVTPRQLLSIKEISRSLDVDAQSECERLFDCDLRTLTVTAAARLIADLRTRLIRQESQNEDACDFSFER
jgi:hypothetical protein